MNKNNRNDITTFLGVVGGLALVGFGIYALAGFATKCNRCDKWFAEALVKKEQLKVEEGARDVERSDKHYDENGKFKG